VAGWLEMHEVWSSRHPSEVDRLGGSDMPVATAGQLFNMVDGKMSVESRVNAVIYGNSGVGKTALVTALPWGTERWGDRAVYVAWDAGSETMLSIRPEDRKHLTVITPKLQYTTGDKLVLNPYKTAMDIATADWATLVPGAKTIIWDGATRLAEQILRAVANTGATVSPVKKEKGEENRLVIGERGTASFMAQPIIADYGMAQNIILQWSEFLRQQPLNVLVVCVTDYYKPEGGSYDGDTIGGPATVGVKIIPKFLKDWDNCLRISIEPETVAVSRAGGDGKPMPPTFERINKRVVWTEQQGIWSAKVRRPASSTNPIAKVELTPDGRDFWNLFDASGIGTKVD